MCADMGSPMSHIAEITIVGVILSASAVAAPAASISDQPGAPFTNGRSRMDPDGTIFIPAVDNLLVVDLTMNPVF